MCVGQIAATVQAGLHLRRHCVRGTVAAIPSALPCAHSARSCPFLDLSLHARSGLQTVLAFSVIVHMCVMMMPGAKDHMMNSVNAYVCRISYADG